MIRLLYFASLRERLGCDSEELPLPQPATVQGLIEQLAARGGVWAEALQGATPVLAAVNQDMARPEQPLNEGDEVALFPPVTGG
ncbi:MAG: molybdopterin converting factor subunit 1 [Gammaproteobacteria bacterium SHHR-1]